MPKKLYIFFEILKTNNLKLFAYTANSSVPSTPVIDPKKAPSFTQEQPQLDAYERALRQRKQEVSSIKRIFFHSLLLLIYH